MGDGGKEMEDDDREGERRKGRKKEKNKEDRMSKKFQVASGSLTILFYAL